MAHSSQHHGLSEGQNQIWLGQEITPEKPLYNMAIRFDLKGELDVPAFRLALNHAYEQFDILRARFKLVDGKPVQEILSEAEPQFRYIEWDKNQNLESWLQKEVERPFHLFGDLSRNLLVKVDHNEFIWLINQHHLVTDATSVAVLYRHMAKWYSEALNGTIQKTETLPQYTEFVQKQFDRAESLETARAYWTKEIEGIGTAPHYYGQSNHSQTTESQRITLRLGRKNSEALRALSQQAGIKTWTDHLSLFNVFLTLLSSLLYRIGDQRKIAIGTPAHNRPTSKQKNMMGMLIELFPIISEVSENRTFIELIKSVQNSSNGFLRHAKAGASNAEISRSFHAVLNYINASFGDFASIPTQSSWLHPSHCDSNHFIRLQVYDFDQTGELVLNFDLNRDIFPDQKANMVIDHFEKLIQALLQNPNQVISEVPLVSEEEIEQKISSFNARQEKHKARSLSQLINNQHITSQNALAVLDQAKHMRHADLHKKAELLGAKLREQGCQAGDSIVICMRRSSHYILSVLASLKFGFTFIPVASNTPNARLNRILINANAKLLITSSSLSERFTNTICPQFNIDQWDANEVGTDFDGSPISDDSTAYIIYTSGSTGNPKGVKISRAALGNYLNWASKYYTEHEPANMPLFTSIGFDLTLTSTLLPLVTGGKIIVFEEPDADADLTVLDAIEHPECEIVKLTPAHLNLVRHLDFQNSNINTFIVGGEALPTELTQAMQDAFGNKKLTIVNEYGPTEATIGCIAYRHAPNMPCSEVSIPIGIPIDGMDAWILDEHLNPVPSGISGQLYLEGVGLADAYHGLNDETRESFIAHPYKADSRLYKTGDRVKLLPNGQLLYLGRADDQVKINGNRVELGEIESILRQHNAIQDCVINYERGAKHHAGLEAIHHCEKCGLPSNYPKLSFNDEGICSICESFESFESKIQPYFKEQSEMKSILESGKETGEYDCLILLSGGKDSTYALANLANMGLKILSFTLDNGFISEEAKSNIRRVTHTLGVDHIFGTADGMNEIFVDSLQRFSNVCNGCFKTIYTLAIQIALEKNIPYIITGLSRGQFFETRLTEELFWKDSLQAEEIDEVILEARKAYHKTNDKVNQLLGVQTLFEDDSVFERVKFLDFYRYSDVSMEDMFHYLDTYLPWVRPSDTGRSTNCLINRLGIYVHKETEGYSNYSFPYSWDVRVGHKTREEALDEINELIVPEDVQDMMDEIGFTSIFEQRNQKELIAYFTGDPLADLSSFKKHLTEHLPSYMIPNRYVHVDAIPLTSNGKVNREALAPSAGIELKQNVSFESPSNEFEQLVYDHWFEVLNQGPISVTESFINLGGTSLSAIRIIARINETLGLSMSVLELFNRKTIRGLAQHIEDTIRRALDGEA